MEKDMKPTKIYILVAHEENDRIYDLGFSEDINVVRKQINSQETQDQLKEWGIKKVEKFEIRDNYCPRNYYPLEA
jgi:hypothetical protein